MLRLRDFSRNFSKGENQLKTTLKHELQCNGMIVLFLVINWLTIILLTLGICTRVTVVILVPVCYQATCSYYIPGLYVENKVPLGFMAFSRYMYALCVFH